jgi:hypothetical protein
MREDGKPPPHVRGRARGGVAARANLSPNPLSARGEGALFSMTHFMKALRVIRSAFHPRSLIR